jgi:ABC-2 type transport system ATP-binding protein
MTASLPLPDDSAPEGDSVADAAASAKAAGAETAPRPAASTAARKPSRPRAPRKTPAKPRAAASTPRPAKPRTPAVRAAETPEPVEPAVSPAETPEPAESAGPPAETPEQSPSAVPRAAGYVVPDDLVIPPKPPLPPTAAATPVVDAPVEEPVADEPVAEEPVADESAAPEPVVDAPEADESVARESVAEDPAPESEVPVAPEPVVEETIAEGSDPVGTPAEELDPSTQVEEPVVDDAVGDEHAEPAVATAVDVVAELPDTEDAPPALRLRGVTKVFGGTRAVDAIDLTVPAGSFYGIVGPNGAGKTTTLSMIAGLLRPDAGTISVAGLDGARQSVRAKRQMGVLPDRLRTFDRLTGRQLLYYYGVLRGLPSAVVESRIGDLARAFDLVDALGRSVSDYSAGMTKKVMLAGAMIHSPRLLVLDEPFESVDPVSSAVILDILSTYVEHGGTVILSSHGMELVERVCSRVAVLVAGQVLAEGTVEEVRGTSTLEERFLELAGGGGDLEGLEWLHTFSD